MPQVETTHDSAIDLYEAGYQILPLWPNAKNPRIGEDWPEFEIKAGEIRRWFQAKNNLGVITGKRSNLVVLDFDEKEAGRAFYAEHREMLKTIVETRNGVHFWFQHTGENVGNGKHKYGDIRGDGGQVVAPVSEVKDWTYHFVEGHPLVRASELPMFDWNLVEVVEQKFKVTREVIRHVDAYLAKIESVQGKHGSCGLMRACYVCRDAGLNEAETMIRLVRWNESALPPWGDDELVRAVTNAFQKERS